MLSFSYTAREQVTGRMVRNTVEAENEAAVAKMIRKEGLVPIEIKPGKSMGASFSDRLHRIKTKEKVLFSRQLSTLINAGLPLVQSLRNVSDQQPNKRFKAIIDQIIADVEGGMALSVALGKHPDTFNRIYVSLVAAGEASGTLDQALERLADQQEKDADLVAKVRGAMVYPVIVLCVMFGVVGFMIVKVLPQVKVLYEGLGDAELPLVTKVLLAISDAIINYWYFLVIVLVILGIFGTKWARTAGGKQIVDTFKLKAWPVAPLFTKMYMARFARTGTTLVSAGVPLLQVLEITSEAINNVHIESALRRVVEKVKGGKALSDSLAAEPLFLSLVPNMIRIGEQSGSLEKMLAKIADYYEKEVDNQVKAISTIIEPVLMVLLGVMAFIIVAAVLLPVYGLAGKSFV
jgi:type II secretory pathway component PulF